MKYSQSKYNIDGTIEAIPIIMYHKIGDNKKDSVTDVDLFHKEIKYLHDNKFKVIIISDLAYNEKHDYLYIKDLHAEAQLPAKNVTTPAVEPTAYVTTNVTTNVTAPTELPTINATTNVTGPLVSPERNHTLDIVKKVLGIP